MSTAPDAAKTSKLGNVSTNFWLGLLVLSMIVFGANTGVATWQGSRLAGAGTGAADLQVLSQQLANQGREAVAGNRAAYAAFKDTRARVDRTVGELQGRFGQEAGVAAPLRQLVETWQPLSKNAEQIVASEPAVLALAGNADNFVGAVPQLQAQLNEVVPAAPSPARSTTACSRSWWWARWPAASPKSAPVAPAPAVPATPWPAT